MRCPACESTRLEPTFRKNDIDVFTCRDCRHGAMLPLPDEEGTRSLYSQNTHQNLENGLSLELEKLLQADPKRHLQYFGDRIDMLRQIPDLTRKRVLDFGCTTGIFVRSLQYAGVEQAEGVDIIRALVEFGQGRGLNLTYDGHNGFLADHPQTYDVLCANNVLEHLPHPESNLAQFHRSLRKDGVLFISVPSYSSLQVRLAGASSPIIDPPHHVHYYTPGSLVAFIRRANFEILSTRTLFWGKETDIYLISKGLAPWMAPMVRHLMFPVKFLIERTRLGGIIQVLARKADL
jgi:2-polyprenyl-3-methyl-5-hydroxy-6-metoxy-1,4-benzoquinol methylase